MLKNGYKKKTRRALKLQVKAKRHRGQVRLTVLKEEEKYEPQ
jgi:hypothetical protein